MAFEITEYEAANAIQVTNSEEKHSTQPQPQPQTTVEETHGETEISVDVYPKFDEMSTGRVALILVGLGVACFLFAIEQTIVATSTAGIGEALNVKGSLTWITTSYLLTTCAFLPITGRLADAIGARLLLIIDVWIFIIGNLIAGLAKNLTQLVAGRLLSGVGGAGILTLAIIVISHLTHEKQRGNYFTLVNIVYTFADAMGPIVGGAFTRTGNWRWIFLFNAPFGPVITVILLKILKLPNPHASSSKSRYWRTTLQRLDILGMLMLIATLTFLVIALNTGGQSLPWNSSVIIGLLCASSVSFAGFLLVEKWAKMPIAPLHLFSKWEWRNVPIIVLSRTLLFFHLFALSFYLPLFLQVIGISPINASALIIPFLSTAATASTICNYLTAKYGYMTSSYTISNAVLSAAMGLLSTLRGNSSIARIVGYSLLAGAGFGCGTQTTVVIAQIGIPRDLLSTVTALVSTVASLGGVLGVAIIGTITQNTFKHHLSPAILAIPNVNVNDAVILVRDNPQIRAEVIEAYIQAWRIGCRTLAGIAAAQIILGLGLREVSLTGKHVKVEKKVDQNC
ncbi:hypothetical protein M422DRAFT_33878 [Sphaerobolus stellatus SS14]|uniref:Major facilitator superfamily (MFS) profile domain-containing protein n=1 Tax=Sphaerobolus stellatus (strain SS14) TaxID=990650 RepID=A0A0C9U2V5_SPHS4|nr:hypothetical protein M422DRAFT_33878 [Sphaerobolus stellatus SS14]